ncbi:Immunoglobulin-binding protein 1 [Fasciola gigantica]|uniref:Immunoglobulin-binding protein 1 n=1 Tax=Fasciola gigantica TaxID=46835 RepID=A0A504Z0X0_FASGI|nr:Immunoglobulin-binding protein 1 [Fasciola gigantica]
MSRKARVEYIQNSEPAFIREFKHRSGIQTSDTVDSKRCQLSKDDDIDGDRPDEQPQLVLDDLSDISEAEAKAFLAKHTIQVKRDGEENLKENDTTPPCPDFVGPMMRESDTSRIVFRTASERTTLGHRCDDPHRKHRGEVREKSDEDRGQVRDRSPLRADRKTWSGLLSFDPEDEDE